jgi:hypothetical protein
MLSEIAQKLSAINKIMSKVNFLIFIIIIASSFSCNSKKIIGNEYITQSESRQLSIKIIDNKNLEIINNLYCSNIPDEIKVITYKKEYQLSKNKIVIIEPNSELQFPYSNNSDCYFLSESYREQKNERLYDGRLILKNKKELYTIEKIDTLKIIKNHLLFYKKSENGSIGYLFKIK